MIIYGPRKERIAGRWRNYVITSSGVCIVMLLAWSQQDEMDAIGECI
jgi:hypothetical protein